MPSLEMMRTWNLGRLMMNRRFTSPMHFLSSSYPASRVISVQGSKWVLKNAYGIVTEEEWWVAVMEWNTICYKYGIQFGIYMKQEGKRWEEV